MFFFRKPWVFRIYVSLPQGNLAGDKLVTDLISDSGNSCEISGSGDHLRRNIKQTWLDTFTVYNHIYNHIYNIIYIYNHVYNHIYIYNLYNIYIYIFDNHPVRIQEILNWAPCQEILQNSQFSKKTGLSSQMGWGKIVETISVIPSLVR